MLLTEKELWVVEAIVSNETGDNNYFLPSYTVSFEEANISPCWTDTIDCNGAKHGVPSSGKEISGVLSSLNKKGYVISSCGREGTATVTREGWKAYQKTMEEIHRKDIGQI